MTHNGKKLWLCACCDEYFSCQKACQSAIEFAEQDNSENYQKEPYKAKETFSPYSTRMNGGLSKFK